MRSSHSIFTTATSAPLPVASAIRRWNRRSPASGCFSMLEFAVHLFSASSMAATCAFFADFAASAAHSLSIV